MVGAGDEDVFSPIASCGLKRSKLKYRRAGVRASGKGAYGKAQIMVSRVLGSWIAAIAILVLSLRIVTQITVG